MTARGLKEKTRGWGKGGKEVGEGGREPDFVAYSIKRLRQKGYKFKALLGYIVRSRISLSCLSRS